MGETREKLAWVEEEQAARAVQLKGDRGLAGEWGLEMAIVLNSYTRKKYMTKLVEHYSGNESQHLITFTREMTK